MKIQIISAGAGSGKTYTLTKKMVALLTPTSNDGGGAAVRATGIIATTFTEKAAAELRTRVREALLQEGLTKEADDLASSLIGTVHSFGVKLLKRFAFEAGVSPQVEVMAEGDGRVLFNRSLATILSEERVDTINKLGGRLGVIKNTYEGDTKDWRDDVRTLCDAARGNNMDAAMLRESALRSVSTFFELLPPVLEGTQATYDAELRKLLKDTITALQNNEADGTQTTSKCVNSLKKIAAELPNANGLAWGDWVKAGKEAGGVGKKSSALVTNLQALTAQVEAMPAFRADVTAFIEELFGIAIQALEEYQKYKRERGLIDYTDMEASVLTLLDNESVCAVLREEIDLLLVDEFQDTNPIQLAIFLKLSSLAKQAIWVGDPKQSIYGFRGADPALMSSLVEQLGGASMILDKSWRSREDLVHFANALFVKAFDPMPQQLVALSAAHTGEHIQQSLAVKHWHYSYDGGKVYPAGWFESAIATTVADLLANSANVGNTAAMGADAGEDTSPPLFVSVDEKPNGQTGVRTLRPSDVAILCATNAECVSVAEALHRAGCKVSTARKGLLHTLEVRVVLACLRYILHRSDSIAVAELMHFFEGIPLSDIVEHRLAYLSTRHAATQATPDENTPVNYMTWADEYAVIQKLATLRARVPELSGYEILNIVIDELELRRVVATWGNSEQRLANIDQLRRFAHDYEATCDRLHTAASLGGLLLWLGELNAAKNDDQAATQNASDDAEGGAVEVLTYHKSKGLEWKLTVCHSLEKDLRDRVWGVNVESDATHISIDAPLSGRWIRYWINPFDKQIGKTALEAALNGSEIKARAARAALEEEARLMYVGFTRAREYLVLPSRAYKATGRLNRTAHKGDGAMPALDAQSGDSKFVWDGHTVGIELRNFTFGKDFPARQQPLNTLYYWSQGMGKGKHEPYSKDVFANTANTATASANKPALSVVGVHQYATPALGLLIGADNDDARVAEALHDLLAQVIRGVGGSGFSVGRAIALLERYNLSFEEEAIANLERIVGTHIASLEAWLRSGLNLPTNAKSQTAYNVIPRLPVRHTLPDGQVTEATIDYALPISATEILLWHRAPRSGNSETKDVVLAGDSAPLLGLATAALRADGYTGVRCFVHFPASARVIELG